ncbi:acyl-CoA thioesterase [Barnesiella propionica]|uniref:acyl-CoA thioesterase n=1 Tax=Barnesiella propionica TaxID=2981781 RepID=UPI0011C72425|nr:acyl-CoA thioesterase [Barnesiella propionica]MCU6768978.1 acyl-CoA thioesterase [Barnesiella propionica]
MTDLIFKHEVPLQLRFNDIDLLGHVNNSVYFTFYDLGKARYFEAVRREHIDWRKADVVVANVNADFLSPIFSREPVAVRTTVEEIGNKSLRMLQQIVNTQTGEVKSICRTVMVGFDIARGTAAEISEEWKKSVSEFEGRDLMRKA